MSFLKVANEFKRAPVLQNKKCIGKTRDHCLSLKLYLADCFDASGYFYSLFASLLALFYRGIP